MAGDDRSSPAMHRHQGFVVDGEAGVAGVADVVEDLVVFAVCFFARFLWRALVLLA
jgi:hypothetical protein